MFSAVFKTLRRSIPAFVICLSTHAEPLSYVTQDASAQFSQFKARASDADLYRFLYLLPKGADLHHHLSGSAFPEWWYELATNTKLNGGYQYYTRVKMNQCDGTSANQFGPNPPWLLFRTIQKSHYDRLDACHQTLYLPLSNLSQQQITAWKNSITLDQPWEGRDEFFQTHWQRLNDLAANPYIMLEILVRNMRAMGAEGLSYLETQYNPMWQLAPDGSFYDPEDIIKMIKARLARQDAISTGVKVKLQTAILRFSPNAEDQLRQLYAITSKHPELFVGLNMVGREDNDKGHPSRFLNVLRELRKQYPGVKLSIHAGEVDEPNQHIRDTLLLGAERIGHGFNLLSDPDTLLLMRHGPYLVEINLISNLLLNYVDTFQQHPFPEYLRLGIPVALSTDDRGMWDSNLTDEYFVAVKEFNLSWDELARLSRNGLEYSFLSEQDKINALADFDKRMQRFITGFASNGLTGISSASGSAPLSPRSFICKHYQLCHLNAEGVAH